MEDQLRAIPPTPQNVNPQPTPRDRGTRSSTHGSWSSHHSRRAPSDTVAARLAQTAGAIAGHSPAQRSMEGAVGQAHGTTSQGVIEIRGLGGHNDPLDLNLNIFHSQLHPVTIPSGGSRLSLILKLLMGVTMSSLGSLKGGQQLPKCQSPLMISELLAVFLARLLHQVKLWTRAQETKGMGPGVIPKGCPRDIILRNSIV